jgi:hypothetical protein
VFNKTFENEMLNPNFLSSAPILAKRVAEAGPLPIRLRGSLREDFEHDDQFEALAESLALELVPLGELIWFAYKWLHRFQFQKHAKQSD